MKNISILSIVGMGGAGKTTLAQLVYNEEKVKEHFQLLMWVCVSMDFNIVNIVKSMIDVATNGEYLSTSNLEVLQKRLHEILAVKKFLLVLDDVWNEETEKWDALKTLLFSVACYGSVIIITTRSKTVASIVGTLPSYNLGMLSEEDSWKLFWKRAVDDDEEEQLVEIGRIIVGKCAGLPLALKVIGALMRTKRDVREWRAISENIIWGRETSSSEILPALKLSYDQLPSYIKQCFVFCAMFPQDYEIQKEMLIQLWMANDFILDDGIMDLEEKGQYIFDELCSRCFFQDIREIEEYGLYYRKLTYCKMHDLMHDLAKHIVGKQCANTLEDGSNEVLHLSVGNWSLYNLDSILKEFPIIRTCLISKYFGKELESGKLSDSMKSIPLKALQMTSIGQLPVELGYMKYLRHLDLSWGRFDFLPETICTLYNLQTLNISYSRVSRLPEGIRYMIGLTHLIFKDCQKLKKLPVGLGQLKRLRTLTEYKVDCGPGLNITELENLNLQGLLILTGLENVRGRYEAEAANMVLKTKLSSLVLKWGSRNNEKSAINDQDVLEGLKPWELTYLEIDGYEGFVFPTWMKEVFIMRNLRTLILHGCINCTTLPLVWQLSLLENLQLASMRSLLYICSNEIHEVEGNGHVTFPNLKKLVMCDLDNLEGWHEKDHKVVAFPKLEELGIECCPKLTGVPYVPSLRVFSTYHCGGIKLLQISNMPMMGSSKLKITLDNTPIEPDAFRPPKNVEIMELSGFENAIPLEEDDAENYQKMVLCDLTIENSNCFFLGGPSILALGFWKYFASLETLKIICCDALSLWPEQEFKCLKCLKELCILGCTNFIYSLRVPSSAKEAYGDDFLPRLEKLSISECPKLIEVPNICSKSLKALSLYECPSLSKEGLNWLKKLRELKKLELDDCKSLKSLPEGLECLTSLEHLTIKQCPEIESFPEGLQQRLSQLQYLKVTSCRALVRRCEIDGDY